MLLDAPSVAYIDPASGGSSGIYLAGLFERMGIAEALKRKSILVRGGLAARPVADGSASVALQQASEIQAVAGVDLIGMLPAEIQNYTVYSGGISAGTQRADAARRLLAALAAAGPTLRKHAMEAPR
jgi:molybdate transport system substrate-binding protein